jgi:NADH dehydrogenase
MLAVTGANGNLGRRLLERLATGPEPVRALVRSAAAARTLRALALPGALEIVEVDYLDIEAMSAALAGCSGVVHLVGIIRESRGNRYVDAHERTAEVLAAAAARCGVERIVALSILGASASAGNECLRSRAAADARLLDAAVDVVVLRVPMVLGADDHAGRALAARARQAVALTLRAESLEQPIDAEDVVAAIVAALGGAVPGRQVMELAGPESLTRRALTQRAAALLGRRTRMISLPLVCGRGAAWLLERLSDDPPVTRAMLGVLDHDDRIDPRPAAAALGIRLTPLDETLRRVVARDR